MTCITCIITYEAVTGVCKPKNTVFTTQTTIVNCIVNYKGFCLICTKNNIIVNNRCVYNTHITNCAKTPNCVECSLTGDICFICADGFVHLSEDPYTCVEQKVDNCLFQSSKYQCIACVFPYTLQNDLCKFDLSGCLKYDKGKCVLCGGKTLLKDGKCIGTVNCVSYKYNTNECGKCVNGFRLTALKNCTDQTANHCETTS